jgi:hypothetical protein
MIGHFVPFARQFLESTLCSRIKRPLGVFSALGLFCPVFGGLRCHRYHASPHDPSRSPVLRVWRPAAVACGFAPSPFSSDCLRDPQPSKIPRAQSCRTSSTCVKERRWLVPIATVFCHATNFTAAACSIGMPRARARTSAGSRIACKPESSSANATGWCGEQCLSAEVVVRFEGQTGTVGAPGGII